VDTPLPGYALLADRTPGVGSKKNLITLPQAKRLLLAALGDESLTLEKAIELVRYYVRRNEIARLAHRRRKLALLENRGC